MTTATAPSYDSARWWGEKKDDMKQAAFNEIVTDMQFR
jgi:hypothetical protein